MNRFHFLCEQATAFHLNGFLQVLQCHAVAVFIPHCPLVPIHMKKALCISKFHQKDSLNAQCAVVTHHQ